MTQNTFSAGWEWRETGIVLVPIAKCGNGGAGDQIGEKRIISVFHILCLQ